MFTDRAKEVVAGSVWGYQWTPDPAWPLSQPEFSPNLNPDQSHDPPPSSLGHKVAQLKVVSLISKQSLWLCPGLHLIHVILMKDTCEYLGKYQNYSKIFVE